MSKLFSHLTSSEASVVAENLKKFICSKIAEAMQPSMMGRVVSFVHASGKATPQAKTNGPFFFRCGHGPNGVVRLAHVPSNVADSVEIHVPDCLPDGVWERVAYPAGHAYSVSIQTLVERGVFPLIKDDAEFILGIVNSIDWFAEFSSREVMHEAAFYDGWTGAYYFDENGILRSRPVADAVTMRHAGYIGWSVTKPIPRKCWYAAANKKWKEGMPLLECLRLAVLVTEEEAEEDPHGADIQHGHCGLKYAFLDRLCTSVQKPVYTCRPEFRTERAFDHVHVTVNLSASLFPTKRELFECIKSHKPDIDRLVLNKIQNDKRFEKYGVPIGALRLSEAQFSSRDNTIEYIFELKLSKEESV